MTADLGYLRANVNYNTTDSFLEILLYTREIVISVI